MDQYIVFDVRDKDTEGHDQDLVSVHASNWQEARALGALELDVPVEHVNAAMSTGVVENWNAPSGVRKKV